MISGVKAKHRKTLEAIFAKPTRGGIAFSEIEALVLALEGSGSWLEALEILP